MRFVPASSGRRCRLSIYFAIVSLTCVAGQLATSYEAFGDEGKTADPKCLADTCDACFQNASPICEDIDAQCKKELCSPICTRMTWRCDLELASCSDWKGCDQFMKEAKSESVRIAMCAQVIAEGCSEHMGCCDKKSPYLYHWVEERSYAGFFPSAVLPLPSCMIDPKDTGEIESACTACKAAVKVTLKENECEFPNPTSEEKDQKPDPGSKPAFTNSKVEWGMQVPKHKSLQDRCLKMIDTVFKPGKGAIESAFDPEQVCKCMGCCRAEPAEPNCPFPIYTFDESFEAPDK